MTQKKIADIGDTVAVTLLAREYIGKVTDVRFGVPFADAWCYEIQGDRPVPFITITRTITPIADLPEQTA